MVLCGDILVENFTLLMYRAQSHSTKADTWHKHSLCRGVSESLPREVIVQKRLPIIGLDNLRSLTALQSP